MKAFIFSIFILLNLAPNLVCAKSKSTILSYYEFSHLKPKQQVEYIKGLREIVLEVEQMQKNMGYETAKNNRHPWMIRLIASAIASEKINDFSKGAPCIYAGRISSYYTKDNRFTCENKWKCNEDRKQIQCNPFLYGKNVCVASGDGATKRCGQNIKESDEEIAAFANNPENAKEYNEFKEQFENFCIKGGASNKADYNYYSCRRIESRLTKLNKIKLPAETEEIQTVEVTAETPLPEAETQNGVCKGVQPNTCVQCPTRMGSRNVAFNDLDKNSKFAQFIETMVHVCNSNVTADSLAAKLGNCSQNYKGAKHISNQEKEILKKLQTSKKEGRWEYTDNQAFESYYGFSTAEVREYFCSNVDKKTLVEKAQDYRDSAIFALDAGPINSIVNSTKEPTEVPGWARQQALRESGDLQIFQKEIAGKKYRKQLAECLKNPATSFVAITENASCTLKNYENMSANQLKKLKNVWDPSFGICVEINGQPPQLCTYCNSKQECNCNTAIPEGKKARVSSLVNCAFPSNTSANERASATKR